MTVMLMLNRFPGIIKSHWLTRWRPRNRK